MEQKYDTIDNYTADHRLIRELQEYSVSVRYAGRMTEEQLETVENLAQTYGTHSMPISPLNEYRNFARDLLFTGKGRTIDFITEVLTLDYVKGISFDKT